MSIPQAVNLWILSIGNFQIRYICCKYMQGVVRIAILAIFPFLQLGVRTEGIQEALLKVNELPENAERIAKMKQVLKAVSSRDLIMQSKCSLFVNAMVFHPLFLSLQSCLIGELVPQASPWPPCMSSSSDRKLLSPTLTKPLLIRSLRYNIFYCTHDS